jgi:hypothetical protein
MPLPTGNQRSGTAIDGNSVVAPIITAPISLSIIEKEYRIDDRTYKVSYLVDKNLPNSSFSWVNSPSDASSIKLEFKLNSDLELIKMFVKLIDKHSVMQNEDGETYAKIVKQLLN